MDGEKITLELVNDALLEKLYSMITDAESVDAILSLTDSVSKLNASYRNNNQFGKPESENDKFVKDQTKALKEALSM